jgi:hypothetical protein
MSMKTASSILSIMALAGTFLVPVYGCGRPSAAGGTSAVTGVKPVFPLLDAPYQGSLETAYFALG